MVAVRLAVVFTISVTTPEKSAAKAVCHFVIFPVYPLSDNKVELVPEHTVAAPAIDPPTLDCIVIFTEPVYTNASVVVLAPLL